MQDDRSEASKKKNASDDYIKKRNYRVYFMRQVRLIVEHTFKATNYEFEYSNNFNSVADIGALSTVLDDNLLA